MTRMLFSRPLQMLALLTVFGFALVAVFAPLLAPYDINAVVGAGWQPASSAHPFGTDMIGRDVASRMIHATRTTLGLALAIVIITMITGVTLGMLAATLGGWIDSILSRIIDLVMALPALILVLFLIAILPRDPVFLVLTIALVEMTRVYRLTRLLALEIASRDFVDAARLRGETTLWIVFYEILPNCWRPLLAEAGLRFVFSILMLSTMSFLGLGIQPPDTDWGSLIRDNKDGMLFGATAVLYPGAAIALLSVAIGSLIDAISRRRG